MKIESIINAFEFGGAMRVEALGIAVLTKEAAKKGVLKMQRSHGFTLVELVTVIVIIGIVAAYAAPRMFDRDAFVSRGFYDQVFSTLRYAQKAAIAQHAIVCVVDTASDIGLFAADCTTPLNLLASQRCVTDGVEYQHKVCSPAGVSITSAHGSLSFTPLGSTPAKKIYSVFGYSTSIIVEAETGYVH